jgi:hypothetical protein
MEKTKMNLSHLLQRPALVSAMAALFITACGGGGSGYGGSSSPSPTPTPTAQSVVRTAALTGAEEVPAVMSAASARGALVVDPTTHAISGGITFNGITPTAAHIHQGAPGQNGAIVVGLTLGTDSATVPANTILTQAQYDALLAGQLYFNIHSTANPDGEIRGQITGQSGVVAGLATLNGAQEVPSVPTSAAGQGMIVVDSTTKQILIAVVTFSGITTATASHIHTGAPGVSGGISVGLTLGTNVATAPEGTVLTNEQYQDLLAGNLYFNVHSAVYTAGEIRGQIAAGSQVVSY